MDEAEAQKLISERFTLGSDGYVHMNITTAEAQAMWDRGRKAHWAKTNSVGSNLLGEPLGSASQKLTRQKLFDLIVGAGLNNCYRCSKPMSATDFVLDHKESWMHASDPVKSFWEKENHSWSHFTCNSIHTFGRPAKYVKRDYKKVKPEKTVNCGFNLPISMSDSLRDTATSLGLSKVDIVREAIAEWLEKKTKEIQANEASSSP